MLPALPQGLFGKWSVILLSCCSVLFSQKIILFGGPCFLSFYTINKGWADSDSWGVVFVVKISILFCVLYEVPFLIGDHSDFCFFEWFWLYMPICYLSAFSHPIIIIKQVFKSLSFQSLFVVYVNAHNCAWMCAYAVTHVIWLAFGYFFSFQWEANILRERHLPMYPLQIGLLE